MFRFLIPFFFAACGTPQAPPAGPSLDGCPVFPPDHVWNARVDHLPLDARSAAYVSSIGADRNLHPDFGAGLWRGAPSGIPFRTVPGDQKKVPLTIVYPDESDAGPYPIPPDAPIEGGPKSDGDRHVLILQQGTCVLYELFAATPLPGGAWKAETAARFDLRSYSLRPSGWTSADAAGFPILPGLLRYDEVAAGRIAHAVRFTAPRTRNAFIWPARHRASLLADPALPPMGQRFRLKASFDLAAFSPEARVILQALKTYGLMLADNGGSWFLSGAPDPRWPPRLIDELKQVRGSDLEAVDIRPLIIDPDSGRARQP